MSSNVERFVRARVDWSFLYDDSFLLNEKYETFHVKLDVIFARCIPSSMITSSKRDKPWIICVIKTLINKRWEAYHQKKFEVYNHLTAKIRREIIKKKTWTKRMKTFGEPFTHQSFESNRELTFAVL